MLRILRLFLKRKYSYLIFFVLLFSPYNLKKIQSSNLDIAPKSVSEEILINRNSSQILTNEYLLGPGDTLFINFKETPIFSGVYTINNESTIFLPELNRFKVNKISAVDLEKELNLRYKQFIYRPDIRVSVQSYRNVNVYIRGAVRRPGLYSFVSGFIKSDTNLLNYSSMSSPMTNNIGNVSGGQTFKITTIYDVIKRSQGFNLNADLTDVVVIRDNSNKQGGGKIYTKVNLLSFLLEGDQTQNIRIYDGDNILIKNGISINEQIVNLNRINISPEIMSVYVSGNVNSPGRKDLKQNSHLKKDYKKGFILD